MPTKAEIDNKRDNIRGKSGIICDYFYLSLPIVLLICFLTILVYTLLTICPQFTTKQAGYLLASSLLILGLIGLCFDNTSLFQQQAFKLLVWAGISILLLTFFFCITIDILKEIKSK